MSRLLITYFFWIGIFVFTGPLSAATPGVNLRAITLNPAQQVSLGVRSSAVERATSQLIQATASVTVPPGREYTVTATVAGTVTRIEAGLGDPVRAGTVLLKFSSPALADLRRQLREAQLDAQNAQATWQRDQAMHDDGLIPTARLQLSLNRYRAAESALQATTAMLQSAGATLAGQGEDYASASVRAPVVGQIIESLVNVGQRVEAGTVLMRIADLRQLQLDLTLSPDKAARIKPGDHVIAESRGATAAVLGVGRTLDVSQQVRARARVLDAGRLQVGETLLVEIRPVRNSTEPPVWQVPARAVVQLRGKPSVFRVTPTGFEPTEVQVISSNDEYAVIRAAVTEQDRVAVSGIAALRAIAEQEQ